MPINNQTQTSAFSRAYNSFGGIDIKAVFANKVMAEIQAISYSITREKAPVYTMGSPDPRAFSRGKRGIAGTLIFIVFDRHTILSTIGGYAPDGGLKFLSDIDDLRPEFQDLQGGGIGSPSGNVPGNTVDQAESPIAGPGTDQAISPAWYVDQIPPFDITLAAANESGALAVMRIFGVDLINEGYGVSVDDMVSEQQYTYVARTIIGWTPVTPDFVRQISPS
jgi:hypothetical protein